jgi:hypothetical protein
MARTDVEVVKILVEIYKAEFGGKENQRYLIGWADVREIYGFQKLFDSRFLQLRDEATNFGLYLWDLGQGNAGRQIAVIRVRTVDRWRRAPKKVIDQFRMTIPDEDEGDDE